MYTALFVDDNRNIREFCGRELEKEGYRVILASDGIEALAVLKHCLPDVVILDIRMPRMDGLEAIGQILNQNRDIPVIFYTAHKEDTHFDFRSWCGVACIEKSEDLTELKSTITRILSQRGDTAGILTKKTDKTHLNHVEKRSR